MYMIRLATLNGCYHKNENFGNTERNKNVAQKERADRTFFKGLSVAVSRKKL